MAQKIPRLHVDDLFIEFGIVEGELAGLVVTFESVAPTDQARAAHANDSFWVHEPRAAEIEEIVLQIASGISMFTNEAVEIPFELRRIEFFKNGCEPSMVVDLGGAGEEPRKIAQPQLIRSVLAACLNREHDPSFTFYQRGAADARAHRYIEAFYNFFFFLEYLFGNGKSGTKATVAEFLSQKILVDTVEKVIKEKLFAGIVSPEFASKICGMSTEELLRYIVVTRGTLHHPNKNRSASWHPDRQREFDEVATLLQLFCLNVATTRFFESVLSPSVEKAFRKAEHCMRREGTIRVVTR
jgi:hypothetical protein